MLREVEDVLIEMLSVIRKAESSVYIYSFLCSNLCMKRFESVAVLNQGQPSFKFFNKRRDTIEIYVIQMTFSGCNRLLFKSSGTYLKQFFFSANSNLITFFSEKKKKKSILY